MLEMVVYQKGKGTKVTFDFERGKVKDTSPAGTRIEVILEDNNLIYLNLLSNIDVQKGEKVTVLMDDTRRGYGARRDGEGEVIADSILDKFHPEEWNFNTRKVNNMLYY